jgi:hypothetical protein
MSKERELLQEIYDDEITMMELPFSTATKLVELLAEPDTITQYLLDQVSRLTAENAMLKEKWSPPKREPLSEDEIAELWWNTYVVDKADSVRNFARAIEKAHGIEGE